MKSKMKNTSKLKLAALSLAVLYCGFAYAHSGAMGVVKQRMDAMTDIAANMKIIGTMLRTVTLDKDTLDKEKLSKAAFKIQQHAIEMPALFPKGSTDKPSEARAEIWNDWDTFTAIAKKLDEDAGELITLSKTPASLSDIKAKFQLVAKSCGACHEKFRLKK